MLLDLVIAELFGLPLMLDLELDLECVSRIWKLAIALEYIAILVACLFILLC